MPERDDPRPSTREVAAEEFLFHLHRGSELLQDNRVHAAKAELERALSLQPSDPKGQDLLGIVYFRLGLYPRAIAIYERLIQAHPEAVEPRINLALSYLKTGQPAQARSELEKALEQNPKHQRAWGYLGLAFQRMGDYERASHAFAAGGHEAMARRLLDMTGGATSRYPMEPPDTEDQPPIQARADARAEVQRAAGEAVQALDRAGAGFRHDSDLPRIPSGTWSAIEPGRETMPTIPAPPSVRSLGIDARGGAAGASRAPGPRGAAAPTVPSMPAVQAPVAGGAQPAVRRGSLPPEEPSATGRFSVRGSLPPEEPSATGRFSVRGALSSEEPSATGRFSVAGPATGDAALSSRKAAARSSSLPPAAPPATAPLAVQPPETLLGLVRERLLSFPREVAVARHATGVVLVQAAKGFVARLDGLRTMSVHTGTATHVLKRQARGRIFDEPLGGPSTPFVEIGGRCELVLGASEGRRLHAVTLGEEPIYLREDVLIGFELPIGYENGRLPAGDGESVAMVQLRGRGHAVLSVPERAAALEITPSRPTSTRATAVLGWMGRLLPRTLPPADAPGGVQGFVTFGGEGMVLVDGR
ncbi:tetratricopeptide repeat protein [Sorangium sp. So ce1024]|uniref:tetratricopeptide repeat protein n=1 Tax=unclassified Sorangium TaxID=2621164 RepID=UPI003F0A370E